MRGQSAWRAGLAELSRPGEAAVSAAELERFTKLAVSTVVIGANLIGTLVVLVLLVLDLVPLPPAGDLARVRLDNGLVALGYVLVAVPLGWSLGIRIVWSGGDWLEAGRPPSPTDTRRLLYGPARLFLMQLLLWLAAALLFSLFNTQFSTALAVRVAIVVSLTGFVTASCAYLSAERMLRSVTARALAYGTPDHYSVPGVITRTLLAWGLGTVVPIGGLLGIGVLALAGDKTINMHNKLAVSTIALTSTGIVVGLLAVVLAVRTTAEPISSVRRALGRVQRGDFSVRVPVYDVSEIGQLQLGFNEMVDGLAERERIREAFGTYVDPDVAERIISAGTNLAGEEVDVTCMFLDVRNFTGFAEQHPADAVVGALNRLFELAVPIIHEHAGRIDKFVGDGLLAVFGAPRRLDDHADQALDSAIEIVAALAEAELDLTVGVGLNSGPVVAGNVGGGGRFEFSVIGDTVNVAARVEAATRQTGDTILVSEHTRERLDPSRRAELVQREGVELKGKHDPVAVYALAAGV